jgi:hypothetical protein
MFIVSNIERVEATDSWFIEMVRKSGESGFAENAQKVVSEMTQGMREKIEKDQEKALGFSRTSINQMVKERVVEDSLLRKLMELCG